MQSPAVAALEGGPFEGLDPDLLLPVLLLLDAGQTRNGRPFYKTYKKWSTLTVDQKTKTIAFWNDNLDEPIRQACLNRARQAMANDVQEERQRQAQTNKHDQARLLHLRADPAAAANWTSALREKSRSELDLRGEVAAAADPWNQLAEKFNDYGHYRYINAVVQTRLEGDRRVVVLKPDGLPLAVTGMEALVNYCFDMNPCLETRPLRDGGWIRAQWRAMKGKLSVCFQNYRKSGNQEAENVYDEWARFAVTLGHDYLFYARALFDDDEMDRLGKYITCTGTEN